MVDQNGCEPRYYVVRHRHNTSERECNPLTFPFNPDIHEWVFGDDESFAEEAARMRRGASVLCRRCRGVHDVGRKHLCRVVARASFEGASTGVVR